MFFLSFSLKIDLKLYQKQSPIECWAQKSYISKNGLPEKLKTKIKLIYILIHQS